ncbi:hypothetical protein Pmani_020567 [Petrolisthes manimaculis]|uniref:Selenoprotein S n=1 Tax=Petrolisthes manimaculis TaxID=1843537 RepID=A0AAE1U6F4_9EUCA|nr:hypothetical protein Pmani_020567 [Petrolisthes manimaculis]
MVEEAVEVMGEQQEAPTWEEEETFQHSNVRGVDPPFFTGFINTIFSFIGDYGWTVVLVAAVVYALMTWLKKSGKLQAMADHHRDPDKFLAREQAMGAARERMQQKYNDSALRAVEERPELASSQRQSSEQAKPKPKPEPPVPSEPRQRTQAAAKKPSGQPKLRPEYNPLMGGGASGWRPQARRGGAGGG